MIMSFMDKFSILLVLSGSLLSVSVKAAFGFGSGSDRVLLRDIQVITLYNGQMTSARRSSPIPQLKCVGGTAGCGSFVPQVVQCHNRGSDGYDVQWECKTDMDNAYRFGQVQVSCEGYDYPDDPYALRGSCGLEYTLDLTKEGHQQKSHGSYGSNQYNHHHQHHDVNRHKSYKSNSFGDIIVLVIIGVIIYALYRTCIANNAFSPTDDGHDGQYPRGQPGYPGGYRSGPPPPGFRDEYTSGGCSQGYSSGYGSGYTGMPGMNQRGGGGGGFWTGAATGGLMGYLLGNSWNRGNTHYRTQPGYGSTWGSSNNSWFSGSGSSGMGTTSTGTRTASGFGGTRRR